jgi:Protein of unknown function (DUF3303)
MGSREERRGAVRFMLRVRIPTDQGNAVMKDGSLRPKIGSIMEEIQPEFIYFTAVDGLRGGYVVVDLDDASQIPTVTEPFFLAFGATVEIEPLMSPEDLANATPAIEEAARKYG